MKSIINMLLTLAENIVCGVYPILILLILLMLLLVVLPVLKVWVVG
jgi:hypothetical protein